MKRLYRAWYAGQKTRVLPAKILCDRPEVLLLDAPTASLDPDSADQVRPNYGVAEYYLLSDWNSGISTR